MIETIKNLIAADDACTASRDKLDQSKANLTRVLVHNAFFAGFRAALKTTTLGPNRCWLDSENLRELDENFPATKDWPDIPTPKPITTPVATLDLARWDERYERGEFE